MHVVYTYQLIIHSVSISLWGYSGHLNGSITLSLVLKVDLEATVDIGTVDIGIVKTSRAIRARIEKFPLLAFKNPIRNFDKFSLSIAATLVSFMYFFNSLWLDITYFFNSLWLDVNYLKNEL